MARLPELEDKSIEELVEIALTCPLEDAETDEVWEAEQHAWAAIRCLYESDPDEVLAVCRALTRGERAIARRVGLDIVARLGEPEIPLRAERLRMVLDVLERETEVACLASAASALGHLRHEAALLPLLRLMRHPSVRVRWPVVMALPNCPDRQAVSSLIAMTRDEADIVRDWATFHLRFVEPTTPEIKEAMRARLNDSDHVTRREALVGLAEKGERSIVPSLRRELERFIETDDAENYGEDNLFEAVALVPDIRLVPALRAMRQGVPPALRIDLERLIAACAQHGTRVAGVRRPSHRP